MKFTRESVVNDRIEVKEDEVNDVQITKHIFAAWSQ